MAYLRQVCFLYFIFLSFIPAFAAEPKEPIRGVWLTTNFQLDWPSVAGLSTKVVESQKRELRSIVKELSDIGINTLFFQARLRGATFYNSQIEPQSRYLTNGANLKSSFDPLEYIISLCKAYNMQCHAWMVCMPLGGIDEIKRGGVLPFFNKNKQYLTYHQGSWYLEPSHPFTAKYLASIASEIASMYAVDGIHLDYIRYPENLASYPDEKLYKESKTDKSLAQWRRDNITDIVSEIYGQVKAVDSAIQVSSAPIGFLNPYVNGEYFGWNAFDGVCQDVQKWVELGIQDFLVPMIYFDTPLYAKAFVDWKNSITGIPVIPGLGVYKLDELETQWEYSDISQQLHTAKSLGENGYVLFRTENVLESNPMLLWMIRSYNYFD